MMVDLKYDKNKFTQKVLKWEVTVIIVQVSKKQNQDVHVTTSMWIFQLIACNVKTT